MASAIFPLNRRELMAGLGASGVVSAARPMGAIAQTGRVLDLKLTADSLPLLPDAPPTAVWSLGTPNMRLKRGDAVEIAFDSGSSKGTLNWWGIDGAPAVEPLPAPAAKVTRPMPLRHAGTFLCELGLLPNARGWPTRAHPLIVAESEPVAVDRDEVVLIEEWRVRADGSGVEPGTAAGGTTAIYTVNGRRSPDFTLRRNERLRLRFINGSQRTVIAVKLEGFEVRVMAIDGQPAEPFVARNGTLLLPPGGRTDVFVEVTTSGASPILLHDGREARPIGRLVVAVDPPLRPAPLPPALALPSNGLPAQLDLKNALRVDLPLGGTGADWVASSFGTPVQPAFRAKAGRVVVLAITNRNPLPTVFHLHGHHFRLLDRLDDGWKPFWLDTLAIESGQTQRIAFAAEYAGRWLLESVATDWASPRLVRWYAVE